MFFSGRICVILNFVQSIPRNLRSFIDIIIYLTAIFYSLYENLESSNLDAFVISIAIGNHRNKVVLSTRYIQ